MRDEEKEGKRSTITEGVKLAFELFRGLDSSGRFDHTTDDELVVRIPISRVLSAIEKSGKLPPEAVESLNADGGRRLEAAIFQAIEDHWKVEDMEKLYREKQMELEHMAAEIARCRGEL